jgi:aspartate/methionine/tyrosine aminotransferase
LAGQRKEILQRQSFLKRNFEALERQGWELLGCGAYFAYVKHPFANSGVDLAQKLVAEAGILCLPGDMFAPPGTPNAAKHLRLAFANIDQTNLKEMIIRLSNLTFQLAPDSSEA